MVGIELDTSGSEIWSTSLLANINITYCHRHSSIHTYDRISVVGGRRGLSPFSLRDVHVRGLIIVKAKSLRIESTINPIDAYPRLHSPETCG